MVAMGDGLERDTNVDERLISNRFRRASSYDPEWILAGASGGANPLWLTEWLAEALDLLELRVGLTGKPNNDVGAERHFGTALFQPIKPIQILSLGVAAPHAR